MNQLELGREHLANGDLKEAIVAFWAAAQEEEDGLSSWYGLSLSLALAGRWEDFVRVMNITGQPVTFCHAICVDLMSRGLYQALSEMHRSIPETHPTSPVAIYFAGVSLVHERRFEEALDYFHLFRQRVLANVEHYRDLLAETDFNVIFRQGSLVEPLDFVALLENGKVEVSEADPSISFEQKAPTGGQEPLYACCLNDLYFLRFADTLVSTLERACGAVDLHFHVVGDHPECLDRFKELQARYPEVTLGLSVEREPIARHSIYYACNRFLVMPQLWDAYDRDVVTIDADGLIQQDLAPLWEKLKAEPEVVDFACFETGRTEPASVYRATLMYFALTPACASFVKLLQRFVYSKLDGPRFVTWMLDQAALFSVSLYFETRGDQPFVFKRLDQITGEGLGDYVESAGDDTEKAKLREEGSPAKAGAPSPPTLAG